MKAIIPFGFFFLISILVSVPSGGQTKTLVVQTDSIRVLLFEGQAINALIFSASSGKTEYVLDGKRIISNDSTRNVLVQAQGNTLIVGKKWKGRQLYVSAVNEAFIRTISSKVGYNFYRGRFEISAINGQLKIINQVSLEDYIASVVGSEMFFNDEEALKAQAIISRSYAIWNINDVKKKNVDYDVTDHTMSQMYYGEVPSKPWYRKAAFETEGEVLVWSNRLVLAVFHSTCGGHTANSDDVWAGSSIPYLQGISDRDACKDSPHYSWKFRLDKSTFSSILNEKAPYSNEPLSWKFDDYGRLKEIRWNQNVLSGNDFRLAMIKRKGSRSLKSTFFTVKNEGNTLIFEGKGMGHGIGLCQWGALGLSKSGWKASDILSFYYRGTDIEHIDQWMGKEISLAKP